MPECVWAASPLHVKCGREAVMVIGGVRERAFQPEHFSRSISLLVNTARSGAEQWKWRALSPMSEGRAWPAVLQLGPQDARNRSQRILVAGGDRTTAEILRVDCSDASDRGQWTQIAPLSRELSTTCLVSLSDRVLALCKLMRVGKSWRLLNVLNYSNRLFAGFGGEVEELETHSRDDVQVRVL